MCIHVHVYTRACGGHKTTSGVFPQASIVLRKDLSLPRNCQGGKAGLPVTPRELPVSASSVLDNKQERCLAFLQRVLGESTRIFCLQGKFSFFLTDELPAANVFYYFSAKNILVISIKRRIGSYVHIDLPIKILL